MAFGTNLSINFQHCCYSNVASNYGYVANQDDVAEGRGPRFFTDLGQSSLQPFFSLGAAEEGFPRPTLKRITLRTTMLAGSEVGKIGDAKETNTIAQTCGLSSAAWSHGHYLPYWGPDGWLTDGLEGATNMGGTQLDFNTADLYTAPQTDEFEGHALRGYRRHSLGASPSPDQTLLHGGREQFAGLGAPGVRNLFGDEEDEFGPAFNKGVNMRDALPLNDPGNTLPAIQPQYPFDCNGPLIQGKGWTDLTQDNPKEYAQSEIYWNWTQIDNAHHAFDVHDADRVGSLLDYQYVAGTLTVGLSAAFEGADLIEDTFSWQRDLIRPVAGAPIRFQTIPFCFESCERAYRPYYSPQFASEIPDLPLYKNGYFHSLVSEPVLYRYRHLQGGDGELSLIHI